MQRDTHRQMDGQSDRRNDGQLERHDEATRLIVAFHNFANEPKAVTNFAQNITPPVFVMKEQCVSI